MEQPQRQEFPDPGEDASYGLGYCSFHPGVETALGCGRCGKYICPRCMIQGPVGARCPDCARVAKIPTFDVRPSYYLRATMAGGAVAFVSALVWWGLGRGVGIPLLFMWILGIGVGYLVGETVSVVTNRKRGTGLAVVAGLCMVLFVVFSGLLATVFRLSDIFGLLLVAVAFYVAISRVR